MGYVNMTVGIGWSIGSVLAGNWYEEGGDKVNLAGRAFTPSEAEEQLRLCGVEEGLAGQTRRLLEDLEAACEAAEGMRLAAVTALTTQA